MTVRTWILLALLFGASAPAAGQECAPWPGEPSPLPTLGSDDPVRGRWAELRFAELSDRAVRLEPTDPLQAHLMWRRVLCLDPLSEEAQAGVVRTRPLRVHRPEIVPAGRRASAGRAAGDPWQELGAPLALAALPRRPSPEPGLWVLRRQRGLEEVNRLLAEAEAALGSARYRAALDTAERARARLDGLGAAGDLLQPRVRLEVTTATARIALGDPDAARAHLVRALRIDPRLQLDPRTTSPKVLRALEAARAQEGRVR